MDGVDGLGELSRLGDVRGRGLAPDDVRVVGVGDAAGDRSGEAGLRVEEALGGALAGEEGVVALVDVARDEAGGVRVRARD